MGANANFCQVLNISQGKYTCFISDEDSVNLLSIIHYLHVFRNNPDISFASGRGIRNYTYSSCHTYKMGSEAFFKTFLTTNYITGLIYRTDLYHSLKLSEWTMKHISTNKGVSYYSQSCWVMFLSLCGNCYEDDTLLFVEGEEEEDQLVTSVGTNHTAKAMLPYTTLESRIEQHNGFIEVLNEFVSVLDSNIYLSAYCVLCNKTLFLLSLVKSLYIEAGTSWDFICKEVENCCYDGISKLDLNITADTKKLLIAKIDKCLSVYKN